jgi:hypothetical protein
MKNRIKRFIGKILLEFINAHIEYVDNCSRTYKLKKGEKFPTTSGTGPY